MIVTFQGEEMNVAEAVKRSGTTISKDAVTDRLKHGWPLMLALFRPAATSGARRGSFKHSREWGKV